MISQDLLDSIKEHEGFSPTAYKDSRGFDTIGYGTRVTEIEVDEATAEAWLIREVEEKEARLKHVNGWHRMDLFRRDIILEMAYQMGVGGVLRFRRMWDAIRDQDWDRAADEMLDSRWARTQTPRRAGRLALRMRAGSMGSDV